MGTHVWISSGGGGADLSYLLVRLQSCHAEALMRILAQAALRLYVVSASFAHGLSWSLGFLEGKELMHI